MKIFTRRRGHIIDCRKPEQQVSLAKQMLKGKSTGNQYCQAISDWRAGKITELEMNQRMVHTADGSSPLL
jgi:hypothetical protein